MTTSQRKWFFKLPIRLLLLSIGIPFLVFFWSITIPIGMCSSLICWALDDEDDEEAFKFVFKLLFEPVNLIKDMMRYPK